MPRYEPGDFIDIDVRKLFTDDAVWAPCVFIEYADTNIMADSGDMLVLMLDRHRNFRAPGAKPARFGFHLTPRHYARKSRAGERP